MSPLLQRRLRSLESLAPSKPPSWEKIFDGKARLLAGLALIECKNVCVSQEARPKPLTEQEEDFDMSVELSAVPEMLWDSGTDAKMHNDVSKAGFISIKVENMSEDITEPSVSPSLTQNDHCGMSVEPLEKPQPLWIGAENTTRHTEQHNVETVHIKVENICEDLDELTETSPGHNNYWDMPIEPLEVTGGTWDDGGDTALSNECIKVPQDLVEMESMCEDGLVHPEFQFNDCIVPGKPLTVTESTEFVGRASNGARMCADVEAQSTSSDDTMDDCPFSSDEETLRGYISNRNKIIFQNTNLSKFPKKFVFRNHAKTNSPQNFSDLQRSTFVRIDYNKRRSVRLKSNRVPYTDHEVGSSSRKIFEQAYIKGNTYHCAKVEKDKLLKPYVDLGFRCDDVDNQKCTNSKDNDRLSAAKQNTVKRRQMPYSRRVRSSEDGNSLMGETSDQVNKMIRVDYCPKTSTFFSEKPASTGSLTYINDKGECVEQMSRSALPIDSLDDEEALGERLYLSDSEDDDNASVKSIKETPSESLNSIFVDDSERFLRRLVKHLNAGGFSCQLCDSKIDWQSVLTEIYNCDQVS
ncbi:uncharacterized protein [Hetaerina americana]|uniref:uncharacterized protein n=1 Tax=Hetaerina americana TaxID=62018 RepID=UPI003A7F2452